MGGGAANKWDSEREMRSVIPKGAVWLKEAVSSFDPNQNQVLTQGGTTYTYDF